jgi:hypothetical protein
VGTDGEHILAIVVDPSFADVALAPESGPNRRRLDRSDHSGTRETLAARLVNHPSPRCPVTVGERIDVQTSVFCLAGFRGWNAHGIRSNCSLAQSSGCIDPPFRP